MAETITAPTSLRTSLEGPLDGPLLVLGNSLGTASSIWDPQLPALRRRFRVLRYELPGHGGSAAEPGPYTLDQLGAMVLALLDDFDFERTSYCGISLGGMIGMWLAANAPDRVSALGLVCTSAYMPPASNWHARAEQVRRAGLGSISGQIVARWFSAPFSERNPAVIAAFTAELERTDPEGYAACCEAIAGMDLRGSLRSITAPTLVISGAEDPATPPGHGAQIVREIPGARMKVVRCAAHLANVSAASEVTSALLAHLESANAR